MLFGLRLNFSDAFLAEIGRHVALSKPGGRELLQQYPAVAKTLGLFCRLEIDVNARAQLVDHATRIVVSARESGRFVTHMQWLQGRCSTAVDALRSIAPGIESLYGSHDLEYKIAVANSLEPMVDAVRREYYNVTGEWDDNGDGYYENYMMTFTQKSMFDFLRGDPNAYDMREIEDLCTALRTMSAMADCAQDLCFDEGDPYEDLRRIRDQCMQWHDELVENGALQEQLDAFRAATSEESRKQLWFQLATKHNRYLCYAYEVLRDFAIIAHI